MLDAVWPIVKRPEDGILQKISLPILNDSVCQQQRVTNKPVFDPKTQVCAGGEGGRGPCNNDSGGPLVCRGHENKWYQLGVVTYIYSQNCVEKGRPDVFTKIPHYIDWIIKTIKDN